MRLAIALSCLLTATAALAAVDITGVVVDGASKPVAAAHVYVYTATPKAGVSAFCPYCYRDCGKQEEVDEKGAFRIEDLDTTLLFDVLAVADGYEPAFARRIDPAKGPITITLRPRSTADADRMITGVVVGAEGKPVVGAVVEPNGYHLARGIAYGKYPGVEKLSITDGKGAFALRIPARGGKLDVRVTARAFAPRIERELVAGVSRTIRVAEGPALTGHLTKNGKPVAGVRIAVVQRDRSSRNYLGRFEVGTNERGLFSMLNLGPDESYVVYAPMEGVDGGVVEPKIVNVGSGKATVDAGTLTVVRGRRVAGKVIVPLGMSIPPHSRMLFSTALAADWRSVELRDDGSFVFDAVSKDAASLTLQLPGLKLSPRSTRTDESGDVPLPPNVDVNDVQVIFDCD